MLGIILVTYSWLNMVNSSAYIATTAMHIIITKEYLKKEDKYFINDVYVQYKTKHSIIFHLPIINIYNGLFGNMNVFYVYTITMFSFIEYIEQIHYIDFCNKKRFCRHNTYMYFIYT